MQIASSFEKRHADVLRDVEKNIAVLEKIGERKFALTNFIPDTYKDTQNKKQPRYLLARDGFTKLVFGYEGEKAAKFQIAYITRFNQMESYILEQITSSKEIHPALMDAINEAHEEPRPYHFSNEQNMIYRIVLGVDAKEFRRVHGLKDKEAIKSYLSSEQIKWINALQRIDIGLHEAGLDYYQRRDKLEGKYRKCRLMLTG